MEAMQLVDRSPDFVPIPMVGPSGDPGPGDPSGPGEPHQAEEVLAGQQQGEMSGYSGQHYARMPEVLPATGK